MRPFTSTISLAEAKRRLEAAVRPIARTERVPLARAAGRVAAADVTSPLDVPPFARSAMDGYAVIAADTAGATRSAGIRLRVIDRIYTGQAPGHSIAPGSCAEIATGAPIPAGADAVVMVEDTAQRNDGPPKGGRHDRHDGPPEGGRHDRHDGPPEGGRHDRHDGPPEGGHHDRHDGPPNQPPPRLPRSAEALRAKAEGGRHDRAEDLVEILKPAAPGQNVGRRGADIPTGAAVVLRGDLLTPGRIGALAAIGCVDVEAYHRPVVAILSTGNEVVEPGGTLEPGQIFDVNRFTLAAVVDAHGGVSEAHRPVQDSIDALTLALDRLTGADLVVFSGGSSVGERDLILDVIAARGEMIFHGISIKPGKPTAFALVGGTPFFGMPGNPSSCLSNAYILLVPFLRATARLPPFQPRVVRAPLGRRIESPVSRHQIYTVRIADGVARPAFKGSGDITSLSQADGYIEIPEDQSVVEQGSLVDVTLF